MSTFQSEVGPCPSMLSSIPLATVSWGPALSQICSGHWGSAWNDTEHGWTAGLLLWVPSGIQGSLRRWHLSSARNDKKKPATCKSQGRNPPGRASHRWKSPGAGTSLARSWDSKVTNITGVWENSDCWLFCKENWECKPGSSHVRPDGSLFPGQWEATEGFEAGANIWLTVLKDASGCYVKNKMGPVKTRVETERTAWRILERSKERMGCLDQRGRRGDGKKWTDLGCVLGAQLTRLADGWDSDGRGTGEHPVFGLGNTNGLLLYLLIHLFIQQVFIECLLYTSTEHCAVLNPQNDTNPCPHRACRVVGNRQLNDCNPGWWGLWWGEGLTRWEDSQTGFGERGSDISAESTKISGREPD